MTLEEFKKKIENIAKSPKTCSCENCIGDIIRYRPTALMTSVFQSRDISSGCLRKIIYNIAVASNKEELILDYISKSEKMEGAYRLCGDTEIFLEVLKMIDEIANVPYSMEVE